MWNKPKPKTSYRVTSFQKWYTSGLQISLFERVWRHAANMPLPVWTSHFLLQVTSFRKYGTPNFEIWFFFSTGSDVTRKNILFSNRTLKEWSRIIYTPSLPVGKYEISNPEMSVFWIASRISSCRCRVIESHRPWRSPPRPWRLQSVGSNRKTPMRQRVPFRLRNTGWEVASLMKSV